MTQIKKRIAVVFLLMSYCFGVIFAPIYAEGINGFDALLSEREGSASTVLPVEKKADISDFADVKENDWFYKYLDYLVKNEIIKGKTENAFEPYSTFSYAECSAVIVRYLGLEAEAAKRKSEISERCPELENCWFSGYFEVLGELGILDDCGLFEIGRKGILSIDTNAANEPIQRFRFAECVSESFELDGNISARNVYSEIGGKGREFIVGGGYDEETLEMYRLMIKDFEEIPESSAEYVLKAYYNGIFNGDISGNFYPANNLTRAEMAKVLATVMDFSLRTRLIEEGYGTVLDENSVHTDAFGVKTMEYETWVQLLYDETETLTVANGNIKYIKDFTNAPYGYSTDVYLYDKTDSAYKLKASSSLHDGNDGFTYKTHNAKLLFVLRNLAENARPEGVVEIIVEDGTVTAVTPKVYEMPSPDTYDTQNINETETSDESGVFYFCSNCQKNDIVPLYFLRIK